MKIRAKITLFTSLFLVLMVIVITYFSVLNVEKQGEERLQTYKNEAIDDIREHLKDLVDVAYETIDKNYSNLSDLDYLSKFYERRLHNIIDTGETIIKRYQRMVKRGELSEKQAKARAMSEIKELRFDGGTGYIWINDTTAPFPTMIMHPTVPNLDGKVLSSRKYNNAMGIRKNLFSAFVEVTRNNKDGYVDYMWPKPTPTGLTKEEPKLSYVRRYSDWNWILGTGIYIDDARVEIENRIKESVKSMRYADGTGYFWINDNTLPYPTMVMHPTVPDLDGKVLDDPKYNNALGKDQNLFQAFAEITKREPGEGFVDYLWPKPVKDGLTERTAKISYVRLHKPTGWIIGSGAYVDNIDQVVADKKTEIESQIVSLIESNILVSLLFIALAVGVSYVFSNTLAKPIQNLTLVAEHISKGRQLNDPIEETKREDEIGELAQSIDRLKISVRIMIERMSRK
ncbi:MAG: cache domain-containing protein [Kangiellaceae bacterium]|jgi:signal transduction histidine kinase